MNEDRKLDGVYQWGSVGVIVAKEYVTALYTGLAPDTMSMSSKWAKRLANATLIASPNELAEALSILDASLKGDAS